MKRHLCLKTLTTLLKICLKSKTLKTYPLCIGLHNENPEFCVPSLEDSNNEESVKVLFKNYFVFVETSITIDPNSFHYFLVSSNCGGLKQLRINVLMVTLSRLYE